MGTGNSGRKMRPKPTPPPLDFPAILATAHQMSIKDLAARIRWHESFVHCFEDHGEPSTARKFQELADEYKAELERRPDTAE